MRRLCYYQALTPRKYGQKVYPLVRNKNKVQIIMIQSNLKQEPQGALIVHLSTMSTSVKISISK